MTTNLTSVMNLIGTETPDASLVESALVEILAFENEKEYLVLDGGELGRAHMGLPESIIDNPSALAKSLLARVDAATAEREVRDAAKLAVKAQVEIDVQERFTPGVQRVVARATEKPAAALTGEELLALTFVGSSIKPPIHDVVVEILRMEDDLEQLFFPLKSAMLDAAVEATARFDEGEYEKMAAYMLGVVDPATAEADVDAAARAALVELLVNAFLDQHVLTPPDADHPATNPSTLN